MYATLSLSACVCVCVSVCVSVCLCHTRLVPRCRNTSCKERENLILGYHSASIVGGDGIRTGHVMSDGMVARLDAAGRLNETKRRLLRLTNAEWCSRGR